MEKLLIVKIGGNIIENELNFSSFLDSFSKIRQKKILVHGGGKLATELGKKLGIIPELIDGRRITDKNTLNIITMIYSGLINKTIVARLQSNMVNAIGISGADANCIRAVKRSPEPVDYGFVGDPSISGVNVKQFEAWLRSGLVPVISPVTHDSKGQLLNTNADTIASVVASALSVKYETSLFFGFEKEGVLSSVLDESAFLPTITKKQYDALRKEKIISGGMIPKIDNAFNSAGNGVKKVIIGHARNISLIEEGKSAGTLITA